MFHVEPVNLSEPQRSLKHLRITDRTRFNLLPSISRPLLRHLALILILIVVNLQDAHSAVPFVGGAVFRLPGRQFPPDVPVCSSSV